MERLIDNLTTFIDTITELYQLPTQLTADFHTLNTYLKSYSRDDGYLLSNFVEKLCLQLKSFRQRDDMKEQQISIDHISAHTIEKQTSREANDRFDFKLNLKIDSTMMELSQFQESTNKTVLNRSERPLSYRSGKDNQNKGVKSARYKFGTRERNKSQNTLNKGFNKENISSYANLKIHEQSTKEMRLQQRSLKFIKSEAEFKKTSENGFMRQNSTQTHSDNQKFKIRYQSNDHRCLPNSSSLKIKLKPKQSLDANKVLEGITEVLEEMMGRDDLIYGTLQKISSEDIDQFEN